MKLIMGHYNMHPPYPTRSQNLKKFLGFEPAYDFAMLSFLHIIKWGQVWGMHSWVAALIHSESANELGHWLSYLSHNRELKMNYFIQYISSPKINLFFKK